MAEMLSNPFTLGYKTQKTNANIAKLNPRPVKSFKISKKEIPFVIRSSVVDFLPPDYGYVILVASSSAVLTQWQSIEVSKQRVKTGIKYPKMYEDAEQSLFNCYQRAHQNTLENYPAFLALLLLSGIGFPRTSAILGLVWVVGRVFYTLGYYTGEPKNRFWGMWGLLGLWGLIITSAAFGVKQLL